MGILRGQRSPTFAGLLIVIAIIEFAPDRVSGKGRICKSGLGPYAGSGAELPGKEALPRPLPPAPDRLAWPDFNVDRPA